MKSEIPLTEIAQILGCCKTSAWTWAQSGKIKGARLVAGRLWVAPRSSVLALKRRMAYRAAMQKTLGSDHTPAPIN